MYPNPPNGKVAPAGTPAKVLNLPSKEWAALRLWASTQRDSSTGERMRKAVSLIAILDTWESLRTSHREVAKGLWASALLLAESMTRTK